MKYKYLKQKLDGTLVYPPEPPVVKSKEDLQRWFEWTDQFDFETHNDFKSLFDKLQAPFEIETKGTEVILKIKFKNCKYPAYAKFFDRECYSVSIN